MKIKSLGGVFAVAFALVAVSATHGHFRATTARIGSTVADAPVPDPSGGNGGGHVAVADAPVPDPSGGNGGGHLS